MSMNVKKILSFTLFCMVLSAAQPLPGPQFNFSTPKVAVVATACFLAGALLQGGIDNHRARNIPVKFLWKDKWYKPSIIERAGFFVSGFFDVQGNARRKRDEIKSIFGYGPVRTEKQKKSLRKRWNIVVGRLKDFAENNKPLEYGAVLAAMILAVHLLDRYGKFDSAPQPQVLGQGVQNGAASEAASGSSAPVGAISGQGVVRGPVGPVQPNTAPRPAVVSVGTSPFPAPRPAVASVATSPTPVAERSGAVAAEENPGARQSVVLSARDAAPQQQSCGGQQQEQQQESGESLPSLSDLWNWICDTITATRLGGCSKMNTLTSLVHQLLLAISSGSWWRW